MTDSRLCAYLELPYPPSVNEYWASRTISRKKGDEVRRELARVTAPGWREISKLVGVSVYRTAKGNRYRDSVAHACMRARTRGELGENPFIGTLDLRVVAHPAQLDRTRDLDNLLKALQDALAFAQVILDDSQFVELRLAWGIPLRDPMVRVAIGRPVSIPDDEFLALARPRESFSPRRIEAPIPPKQLALD